MLIHDVDVCRRNASNLAFVLRINWCTGGHYGLLLFWRIAKGSISQEKRLVARLHVRKSNAVILTLEVAVSTSV